MKPDQRRMWAWTYVRRRSRIVKAEDAFDVEVRTETDIRKHLDLVDQITREQMQQHDSEDIHK